MCWYRVSNSFLWAIVSCLAIALAGPLLGQYLHPLILVLSTRLFTSLSSEEDKCCSESVNWRVPIEKPTNFSIDLAITCGASQSTFIMFCMIICPSYPARLWNITGIFCLLCCFIALTHPEWAAPLYCPLQISKSRIFSPFFFIFSSSSSLKSSSSSKISSSSSSSKSWLSIRYFFNLSLLALNSFNFPSFRLISSSHTPTCLSRCNSIETSLFCFLTILMDGIFSVHNPFSFNKSFIFSKWWLIEDETYLLMNLSPHT